MDQNFHFDAFVVYGWGVDKETRLHQKDGVQIGCIDAFAYEIINNQAKTIVFGKSCQINVRTGKLNLSDEEKACVDLAYEKFKEKHENDIVMTLGFHTALYGVTNNNNSLIPNNLYF